LYFLVINCDTCLSEHKTVVDQSRFEVYDNDADSEVVWQSHHLEDCSEDHRPKESEDGECCFSEKIHKIVIGVYHIMLFVFKSEINRV